MGGPPEDLPLLPNAVSTVKMFSRLSACCERLPRRVGVVGGVIASRLVVTVAAREIEFLLDGDLDQSEE